jgi:hypothetical protein
MDIRTCEEEQRKGYLDTSVVSTFETILDKLNTVSIIK